MKCTFNILVSLNLFLTMHIYTSTCSGEMLKLICKNHLTTSCSENVSETFLHKSKFNFIKKKLNALVKR